MKKSNKKATFVAFLDKYKPYKLRNNMNPCMGKHRIFDTALSVKAAEDEAEATVHKEAAEDDHGR